MDDLNPGAPVTSEERLLQLARMALDQTRAEASGDSSPAPGTATPRTPSDPAEADLFDQADAIQQQHEERERLVTAARTVAQNRYGKVAEEADDDDVLRLVGMHPKQKAAREQARKDADPEYRRKLAIHRAIDRWNWATDTAKRQMAEETGVSIEDLDALAKEQMLKRVSGTGEGGWRP